MNSNISESRRTLSIYINRPSKLGYGNAEIEEAYQFLDMIANLCYEHSDLKFEYDGDTKCCICLEYYHENDNLDQIRIKLQKCHHQAHKDCLQKRIQKYANRCHLCSRASDWEQSWKNEIQQVDQYEPEHREPKRTSKFMCVAGYHPINDIERSVTNTTCQHMYCREHFIQMITEYKCFSKFKESEVICLKCKQPLDEIVLKSNDPDYFTIMMLYRHA